MSFKVSIENLSHQFRRTQKVLSKDLAPLSTLHGAPESDPLAYHNSLQSDIQKIQNLLRILENSTSIERDILISLEARINDSMNESEQLSFEAKLLVMIGVALLQRGLFAAVDALISDSGPWLAYYLDVDIYRTAAVVVEKIRLGDFQELLNWISNHASKLRRLGSKLEFFVRQEQFLSMVYVGNIVEALHFAQENMAPLVVDQEDLGEPSEKSIQSIPTRAPDASAHRNRAVSLGASPRISSSPIDFSAIRPSSFMLPFSFPANPLSFLTSRSEARSTNESQISRENRSMTIGCASSCDHLTPSCNNKESVDSTLPLTVEDHNTYIKEAMCHLMSMLAFGTQGHNGAKGQGSFINVVPQIYLPESKELRLRYLVDVFHLEVRRVYRISKFCPMERMIEYGIFSLKTNSCYSKDTQSHRSIFDENSSGDHKFESARSPAAVSGNAIMMTALRILQQGIARTQSHERQAIASPSPPILSPQFELMSKSPLCPVCSIPGQILAPHLPSPARSSSKIKCRGSGEVMNHNNPPMVLPNGQVYSKKFLNSQKRSRSSEETTLGSLQANKGIDILIAWRENERQKPSNLEPDSNRLQFGSISRTFKSPKAEQKFADIPESSNFFCCPTTNQTFQPDHDTKPVYII